jgi:hypothetical protein
MTTNTALPAITCVVCGQPIPPGERRYDTAHQPYDEACYEQTHGTDSRSAGSRTVGSQAAAPRVVIEDIRMTFGSMVVIGVKWAIASIPAAFILVVIGLMLLPAFLAIGGLTHGR